MITVKVHKKRAGAEGHLKSTQLSVLWVDAHKKYVTTNEKA